MKDSIYRLKRFCRLMEFKNDNSELMELSFLINSHKIQKIKISKQEKQIFDLIQQQYPVSKILNFFENNQKQKILDYINFLISENLIEEYNDTSNLQFDRHDLFFDMLFSQKNVSEKYLSKKIIMIVGCGGIGNNIVQQTLRMGFKKFLLIDSDVIELSNLTRQFLFNKEDIGKKKTEVLKEKILAFDSSALVYIIDSNFELGNKDLNNLCNLHPDFAFLSADSPTTIVKDAYKFFIDKKIPYTTVGYLNDCAVFGPIIDKVNKKYEKYIFSNQVLNEYEKEFVKKINKYYQAPSFGPINSFASSCAVYDMVSYFLDKTKCNSYEKKIIFSFINLNKTILNFSNPSIGVFSSSSPLSYFFSKRMNKTREIFKNNELIVNFGKLYNQHIGKYTTATIIERAQEFNELLKSNDILISSIGGFNSASILDKIDYDIIKQNKPKILGLSDTTSILLAIYKKTGIPTFYGQSFLKSFDEQELIKQENINIFFDLMIFNKKNVKIKEPKYYIDEIKDWNSKNRESILKPNRWIWLNKNNVTGRLIGGNLNTMISMLGTKYMPEIKEGDILFFEDSEKTIAECERNFASLKNSGILDIVSAIIVGKPEKINLLDTNITYEDLFLKFIDRKIPIIMKFDCGHTLPSFILKIGGQINIDPDKEIITIF